MKSGTKNDFILIAKTCIIAIALIFGSGLAYIMYMPFVYEAYENGIIGIEVYYIIWAIPIVSIILVFIGTYFHVSREPERKKTSGEST